MNTSVPTRGNMVNDAAQILLPKDDSFVYHSCTSDQAIRMTVTTSFGVL
jgi:hypothetical protein